MSRDDERFYVETLSPDIEEPVALVEPAAPVTPPPQAARRRLFRMGFFQKVTLHIVLIILASGIALTAAMAFQFRQVMYQQEYRSAFTVFTAAANYVAAHHRSHKGKFIPEHLNYVFKERFMRVEGEERPEQQLVTHQPAHLVIYNLEGLPIYQWSATPIDSLPAAIPVDQLSSEYHQTYSRREKAMHVMGSIAPENAVVAYLSITFPSLIEAKMISVYRRMGLVMLAVAMVAIVLSLVFTRRELIPIQRLIRAAHQVHEGDLQQQVPVRAADEIGELTQTFNSMVSSLARRISSLHRMQDSLVKVGRELESERLYQTLVTMFLDMAGATAGRLYIYNPAAARLESRFQYNAEQLPPPSNDPLAEMTFEDRWTHFINTDDRVTVESPRSVEMAIPLLSGKHRIGVIRIGRPLAAPTYDEETLTILRTLAQYASMAVENAHLYGRLAERERIEQEMRWARNIQQSMLPRERPRLAGFEIYGASIPATEVGGDYFDYISSDNHTCNVVIGDVSGKGVPAALIMSTIRSLMHTYLQFMSSPRDVLNLVNRSLSENLDPDMFVTLSSLRLDADSNRASMARAGHEPIIRIQASGRIDHIAPRGAALGLLEVDRFTQLIEELEFDLEHHDTLVLYTDGITEAQNEKRVDFGQQRLEDALTRHAGLAPEALHRKIMEEVSQYATGMPQHDDITLVIIRRNGA
jgi:sigma-B regulation protein RsbU (phosphoserine phosphatase)